ncbi:MAG: GNAT family N-acetyltransferase [Verrucomicrobia bacterium]|nr:GNAT family N-acetyltransferase [Verrucomicrobiota bacterium]MBS0636373.1 GNAT family N-acetyltransferase [Verrucomicrobiota bacterium]
MTLHAPETAPDWDTYHQIRITQIHNRYCPDLVYDYNDPEEKQNHPRLFKVDGKIVGVIRIDLLQENEASFRWIAIDPAHVRQGLGTKMLTLAEEFVKEHGRTTIRIPATAQSLAFAHTLGYKEEPWALMPNEACMIAVSKRI